ncbi:hypothetical protein [Emticicia sp.]|uniref:hypothetical protein n=1 Tax=Emticicia sp. TaxID=1930953 RepID=UPI003752A557
MLGQLTMLSFKAIDNRLKTFVESHNNLNILLDGTQDLPNTIRITRKSALRSIVYTYRNFIYDYQNNKDWQTKGEIPEMPMNRKVLSKMVGCAEKTAYNHIKFLIEAGVLTKQLHGRQNNFGLFLNPFFWLSEAEILPNIVMKSKTQTPAFALSLSPFLPPISSYETQEIYNNNNADVETVEKVTWEVSKTTSPQFQPIESDIYSRKSFRESGFSSKTDIKEDFTQKNENLAADGDLSTLLGGKLAQVVKNLENKSNGVKNVGGNESLIPSEVAPQSITRSKNEQEAWELVKKFTDYALVHIYQSNDFNKNFFVSQAQYQEIKNLVMRDVFGNFQNATEDIDRIRQKYTDAILAVDKAIAYAKKHNWTSFLHPKCYFSKSFQNLGKRGTFFEVFQWQIDDKHKLQGFKKDEYVQKAKYSVTFEKSPRGRKDLTTRLQISSYYRTMIAKRCGSFHVSIFNQWLSNSNNF